MSLVLPLPFPEAACCGSAEANSETGGVGLGLTIARDVARNHGGDLVLEDTPGGGLRARIWLPI